MSHLPARPRAKGSRRALKQEELAVNGIQVVFQTKDTASAKTPVGKNSTGASASAVKVSTGKEAELIAMKRLPKELQHEHHLAVFTPYYDPSRGCAGVTGLVRDYAAVINANNIQVNGERIERTVYLRRVPPSLTLGILRTKLDEAGTVLRIRLVPPSNWYSFDKQWMYGFVEYQDRASAELLSSRDISLRGLVERSTEIRGVTGSIEDRSQSDCIRPGIAKGYIGNHFKDDAYYDPSGQCQTGLGLSASRTVEEYALSTVRARLSLPEGETVPSTNFTIEGAAPQLKEPAVSKNVGKAAAASEKAIVVAGAEEATDSLWGDQSLTSTALSSRNARRRTPVPTAVGDHVPILPTLSPSTFVDPHTTTPASGVYEVQLDCQVANSGRLNIGGSSAKPNASEIEAAVTRTPEDVMVALRRMQAETASALQAAEARANESRAAAATAALDDDSSDESSSHTTSNTWNTSSTGSGSSGSTVIGKDGQPLSRKAARGKLRKDRQLGKKIAALATAIVSSTDGSSSATDTATASSSSSSSEGGRSLPTTPQHQAVVVPSSSVGSAALTGSTNLDCTESDIEVQLSRKKLMARRLEAQLKAYESAKLARTLPVPVDDHDDNSNTAVTATTTLVHTECGKVQQLSRRQKAFAKREAEAAYNEALGLPPPALAPTSCSTKKQSKKATSSKTGTPKTETPKTETPKTETPKTATPKPKKVRETVDICVMGKQVGRAAVCINGAPMLPAYDSVNSTPTANTDSATAFTIPDSTLPASLLANLPRPPMLPSPTTFPTPTFPTPTFPTPTFPASAIRATPFVPGAMPPPYLQFPSLAAPPFSPSSAPTPQIPSVLPSPSGQPLWSEQFMKWLRQKSSAEQMKVYLSLRGWKEPINGLVHVGGPSSTRDTSNDVQPTQRRMAPPVRALLEQRRIPEGKVEKAEKKKEKLPPPPSVLGKPVVVKEEKVEVATPTTVEKVEVATPTTVEKVEVAVMPTTVEEDEYELMLSDILSVFDTPAADTTAPPVSEEVANVINEFLQQQQQEKGEAPPTLAKDDSGDIGVIGGVPSSCSSSCGSHPQSGLIGGDGETDDVQSGSSVAQDAATAFSTPFGKAISSTGNRAQQQAWNDGGVDGNGGEGDDDEDALSDGEEVNIDIFNELMSECRRPDPVDCEGGVTATPLSRLHSMAVTVNAMPSSTAGLTKVHAVLDSALSRSSSFSEDDSAVTGTALELRAPLERFVAALTTSTPDTDVTAMITASATLLRSIKDVGSSLSLSLLEDDSDMSSDSNTDDSSLSPSAPYDSNKPLVCLEMIALEELRAVVSAVMVCVSASSASTTEPRLPAAVEEAISSGMEWLAEASSPRYLTTPSALVVSATTELLDELNLLDEDEESETFRLAGAVAGYVHVRHQQNLIQCAALASQGLTKGAQIRHAATQLVGPLKSQHILLSNQHKRIKAVFSMTGARCGRKDMDICMRATAPSPNQLTTLERFFEGLVNRSNTSILYRLFSIALPPTPVAPVSSLTQVLSEIEAAVSVTKDAIKRINTPGDKPPLRDVTTITLLPSITH